MLSQESHCPAPNQEASYLEVTGSDVETDSSLSFTTPQEGAADCPDDPQNTVDNEVHWDQINALYKKHSYVQFIPQDHSVAFGRPPKPCCQVV